MSQETQTEVSTVEGLLGMLDTEEKTGVKEFIDRVGKDSEVHKIRGSLIDSFITEIDKVIGQQMDEVLHHPEFQELESAWRGLQYMVNSCEFSSPIKIELLDVPKEELFEDLDNAVDGDGLEVESGFFHHVYWNAYDIVGGHPYTAIVADYQTESTPQDVKLLRYMSMIGESAQIPFIGSAGPEFFKAKDFEEVINDRHLEENMNENAKLRAWHSFRDEDRSKYIGLALPRFLGRLPYDPEQEPTKNFAYKETTVKQSDYSWCSASYAMAANMLKSFEKWGWSVKIVGVDSGGRVEGLPPAVYEEDGEVKQKVPLEARVGEQKEYELSRLGFMSMAHWDRTDYACFFEAPSVQRVKKIKDVMEQANQDLGTRLQYTMLVTRIAHYLKYRQLRFVGRNAGASVIEKNLSDWLTNLVTENPSPTDEQVAQRPLRSFELEVKEMAEKPGFFQIKAQFKPHVAIVGMDINLQLVAFHSDEDV